jgi:hypothetical protein
VPLRPSRGASAVPEAFGILGPIPTIPSGCSGSLAAGADVLSRPSPRAALSPREAPVPSACPCQRIRAVTSGQPRLMEIGSDLAVRRRSWTGALLGSAFQARDRGATIGAHSTAGSRTTADTGGRPSRSSAAPFGQQHRSSDHPGSLSHGGSRLCSGVRHDPRSSGGRSRTATEPRHWYRGPSGEARG